MPEADAIQVWIRFEDVAGQQEWMNTYEYKTEWGLAKKLELIASQSPEFKVLVYRPDEKTWSKVDFSKRMGAPYWELVELPSAVKILQK